MLSIETGGEGAAKAALLAKLSVLFVEDDDEARENMASYLARRVNRVHATHNGLAGLDMFKGQHPDLVISDIRMGGMDGLDMCRAIREIDHEIPLILISAHNESDVLLSSIDLGIVKFIVKPVDTDVLMATLVSVAESLDQGRKLQSRLRKMDSMLNETDYQSECIKSYVSRYLEANHRDEISSIRYLNIPKLAVSGDFYSVEKYHDDLYVMLADGAGHGLSAVIPALQVPRIFQQRASRGFSLLSIAAALNRSLYEQNITEHFVAATLVRLNPGEHFIEVLNCGNPAALIFDDAGTLLHTCHSRSTALGMVGEESFSVEAERFRMERNASIYLYTDGLVDTLQACDPQFDNENKLHELFGGGCAQDVFGSVSGKVEEAARQFRVDDVTLLEINFDCNVPPSVWTELPPVVDTPGKIETPVALDQMTLLYVEDDDLTRDYLALYLNRRLGMVYVAKNGSEGLALFIKHRPQIVLSDIKMPRMNGLEMAEEIRKLDKYVPIIVISGSDHAEDAERMFEMGISRFHLKPLDPGKLTGTIQACARQSEALNRLRLAASALGASSLAVVTVDRQKRIAAVNPAFCRITGYTQDEMLGQNPMLLSSGKHEAGYYQQMWQTLEETGSWSGELLCQNKDGITVSGWSTVNEIKEEDGKRVGYHFVFSDNAELKINEEKARQLKLHDSLTHLPNREMFAGKVNELLENAGQKMEAVAMIHINLDHFTEINNILGVSVGDEVLFAVGQRLLNCIGETETVCRLGGDEFALLISRQGGRDVIEQAVVEMSRLIGQPVLVNCHEIQLRVSIGIGLYTPDGVTYEELAKSASSAMNQAQLAGGDTYRFFDKSISQREEREVTLQHGIKPGLQKNEFYMLYQPKFSFSQSRVVGAEALVRWGHPAFGVVSPAEFIPLAEKNGAVIEMSEWIIDAVCAQLDAWRRLGLREIPVSINISPIHFWRGDLVGALRSSLQKWDIRPAMLPIEVTEGVVMDNSERTLQVLAQLKELGFHLSIDDFGTGYSSLKYLKDLPISELKIDRSFIIEIPEPGQLDNLSKTAIPRAIIQLASEFNLAVVAEGVETESQKNFLIENGCDVIQGYLISRPIPAREFAVLLS